MRRIEIGGIAQRCAGRIVHVVEDEFLARETRYVGHDRRRKHHAPAAWPDIALPSAPDDRVAACHHVAVSGVGYVREIVYVVQAVTTPRAPSIVVAIDHLVAP